MGKLDFIQQSGVLGYALLLGPGIVLLLVALAVKGAVKTTHNFVISGRLLGFGFGVASLISVWTWSMAVMLSSAQAYTWGTSGLVWFIVPNGLAVIIMVPFGLKVRQKMPAGYTLAEFIRARFQTGLSSVATLIFLIGALLGVIMINLAGLVLIMHTIFGLTPISIVVTGIIVVTVYSYFGGLTTSAVTGTLNTLLLGVGSSVVVLYALAKAGGAQLVFEEVDKLGDQHLNPFNPVTAASFGLALALGLLTNVIADQSFWQRVWAIRPNDLGRSFLWAGVWFYPIPLALGLLGFIGLAAGVTLDDLGSLGAGAVGPHVIASLGLPVFIIALYSLVVVNACFAAIDGALSGVTSLVAVDIVHRYWPQVSERRLLGITKTSMIVAAAFAGGVVLTGIDYVNLVTTVYFYGTSLLIPVTLSIFWNRMTGAGYVWGVVAGVVVGGPLRETLGPTYGPLFGIIGLIAASAIVSVVVSLRQNQVFDFDSLAEGKAALLEREKTAATTDNASEPEVPTAQDVLPEPAGQQ
ncbi:sodium:solute symporter family protein [Mycolicibacterium moriokaense]|uniref:Na+/proline symporter n=1 Tax=Mycolicibacterium moriokaense TaxID=39691 RepID=A0A318HBL8_9MYCO|nr:sodium:solute symporter [Mycolicibacterium moriokaense]PXX05420.1 Na+/proline symporter [Mycolicibacterium moriokaense]